MSDITFPNDRLEYAGTGTNAFNPVFISDIVNATQSINKAMQSISDFRNTDFYIVSGFDLDPSTGYYSAGIAWISDAFYFYPGPGTFDGITFPTISNGQYLQPFPTNVLNKLMGDGVSHNYIYTIYYAQVSNTQPLSPYNISPIFSNDMDIYKIGMKKIFSLQSDIINLQNQLTSKLTITTDTWHDLSLIDPASNVSGYTAQYRLDAMGNLLLRGNVFLSGTNSAIIAHLPLGYIPAWINIAPDGSGNSGGFTFSAQNVGAYTIGILTISNRANIPCISLKTALGNSSATFNLIIPMI